MTRHATRPLRFAALAIAAASLATAGAAAPAKAQQVNLRLHTHVPPVSSSFKNLQWWAGQVEKASHGRIKIALFGSNQLGGKAADIYDQVAQGVVDIGWTIPGYLPGRFPRTAVFELPFMGGKPSYVAPAIMAFYPKYLTKEYGDTHVLVLHAAGATVLHSRDRPIRTLADMKGLKVRTSSRIISDAISALGAIPIAIPGIHLAEDMIHGVIDAAAVPWNISLAIRLVDTAKFHTEATLNESSLLLTMNKTSYAKLSAADKAAIDSESGMKMAKIFGEKWEHDDLPGVARAKKLGHPIYKIRGAEEEKWKQATEPVIQAWIKQRDAAGDPGEAMVRDARALVAKYKAEIEPNG